MRGGRTPASAPIPIGALLGARNFVHKGAFRHRETSVLYAQCCPAGIRGEPHRPSTYTACSLKGMKGMVPTRNRDRVDISTGPSSHFSNSASLGGTLQKPIGVSKPTNQPINLPPLFPPPERPPCTEGRRKRNVRTRDDKRNAHQQAEAKMQGAGGYCVLRTWERQENSLR